MIAMEHQPPAIHAPVIVFEIRHDATRPADVIDSDRMIACLLQVEGNPWSRPGGGLGWTRAAWYEDTEMAFHHSQRKVHAYAVAKARIARFIAECAEIGLRAEPIHVADAWRRGFQRAIHRLKHGLPFPPLGYAQRAANLYNDQGFKP